MSRNISFRYSSDPLSTAGNAYSNGRFHRKGVDNPTLYLAQNEHIAHAERRISGLVPISPHLTFWTKVRLNNILDLSTATPNIFINEEEKHFCLNLPYRYFNDVLDIESFSQIFARKARDEGFEGVLYNSVRSEGLCLAIFTDRLLKGSDVLIMQKDKDDFRRNKIPEERLEIKGVL